ncbi:MAG: homocitrate synthase family protein [ANME-2 cluster archaeon]|jgi:methanogen homocitrate synthase|nr:homocitrate synthase family protein [ANME-2 cluster archaeon]
MQYSRNKLVELLGQKPGDIEICDVTLRDGEQTPGTAFTKDEKKRMAQELDSIGIEVIEAGFPVVSQTERDTVREIANMGLDAKICCLSRSVIPDIDVAIGCEVDIVSIFIATSELHLKYKYHKTCAEATLCAMDALEYAKDHGLTVRFAAEDATRTDINVLKGVFRMAEERGADYVSIADTVGILNPATAYYLVSEIKKDIKTDICIHCHNDLGMATANTLAAAEAGAKQLHTTVNGIGERAGNAALEEVLISLMVQYGIDRYNTQNLTRLSKMVVEYSGVKLAKNKPVVGDFAFSHESGIHVAAIMEEPSTYELFSPDIVGGKRSLIIGKHTGTKALKGIVLSMGYNLNHDQLCELLAKVKDCTHAKKGIPCKRLDEFIKEIIMPD